MLVWLSKVLYHNRSIEMKKSLLFLSILTTCANIAYAQDCGCKKELKAYYINPDTVDPSNLGEDRQTILSFYNEQGIYEFFTGKLDRAVENFDYVLNSLNPDTNEDRQLLAIALWCRMLCHAFSNSIEKTYADIQLIRYFFINANDSSPHPIFDYASRTIIERETFVLINNKYSDGNQRITPAQCRDRVFGTANAARMFSAKIPDPKISWLVNTIISDLENFGNKCCEDAPDWTKCLDPITNAWQKLKTSWPRIKEIMDQGVVLAPYLAGPGVVPF